MTTEAAPVRTTTPLLSLQVLRAVAASLVLVHHAAHDADVVASRTGAAPFALDRFVDLGFGVHIFFVVSGFIMLVTARGFGSARGAWVFAARRIVRVVPLYWLLTSLVLVGAALAPGLLDTEPGGAVWVLGSYVFVPVARAGGSVNPVLGQGWTLDYEMFFYALFAGALLFPRRSAVPALAAVLVGLVVAGRVLPMPVAAAAVWTDGLLLEFLFGMSLGVLHGRRWRLSPRFAIVAALLGATLMVGMGPATGRFEGVPAWIREGAPAALLVGACALGPRWRPSPAVVGLAMLGDASYSLYLSHPFAVRLLREAWLAAAPGGAPPALYLAVACAAAVGAALGLHRWVERPLTEALGGRVGPRERSAPPILPEAAEATLPDRPLAGSRPQGG